jgi:hypothetical protein
MGVGAPAPPSLHRAADSGPGAKILRACRGTVSETDHQIENRSIVKTGRKREEFEVSGEL